MPGRNGMGPMGQGAMTGGRRGRCGGANPEGELPAGGPGFGMGRGFGRGGGWQHRRWFHATGLPGWQRAQTGETGPEAPPAGAREQELAALKRQAAGLERALGALNSRIRKLDEPTPGTSEKEHE